MLQKLTIQRVTFIILFAFIFMIATRAPVDTDMWWHIRAGEHTARQRAPLTYDPFSHTMDGQPWINHSWGSQIIIYLFYRLAGSAGLAIYTALLATAGMSFVYSVCEGNIYIRGFALIIGAAAAAIFWSPRPQMISFALSAVVAYLLYRYRHGTGRREKRLLWLIPPIMFLWVNLHGGFAIGFILMLGYLAGAVAGVLFRHEEDIAPLDWKDVRQIVVVAGLSLVAICLNPYGAVMLTYPFRTVGIGALQDYIQEWASPDFHAQQTWPFVILLLGVLGFGGLARRRLDWIDMALVTGTGFMALMAGRNIAVFAIVATPALTRYASAWLDEHGWTLRPANRVRRSQAYLNLVLLAVILLVVLLQMVGTLSPAAIEKDQTRYLPVRAAEWLNQAEPDGLMFNSYNWGGYLMFAAPDYPVFVDGRTDLYDDAFLRAYLDAWLGRPGWEDLLDTYDIGFVVVEAGGLMANALGLDSHWALAYDDGQAVIYIREGENG